jgi:hypothetical protein
MRTRIILASLLALALPAAAQPASPPVENVIVTAPALRTERALNNFIIAHAAATPALGKIARWRSGICPLTVGLPDRFDQYISQRILRFAVMAGAPRAPDDKPCRPNILVVATPEPQALLDFVRAKRPALLGFHYKSQAERIATMTLPVQAWYSTATQDFHGFIMGDLPSWDLGYGLMSSQGIISSMYVSGSRIADGLKSEFTTALILVDARKIGGREIGPLADYIAMLALSQGQGYETCQSVPTITNLMAPDCGADLKPPALTDIDATYLRGLYQMAPDRSYQGQRGSIAFAMKKELGGY